MVTFCHVIPVLCALLAVLIGLSLLPVSYQFTTELKIPKEHHKSILGKQGTRLKNVELNTATKIHMPRADEPSESIRISGTKEGVDKAKHQIQIISDEQV